jgi:hypothetical protein
MGDAGDDGGDSARGKRQETASAPDHTPPPPRKRTGGGRGRRFEKGNQAGKGHGRPKRDAAIDEFFDVVVKGELKDGTPFAVERRVALLERIYTSAMNVQRKDHTRLLEIAAAYCFGKPRERLEMSGPEGGPIASADATPARRRPTTGELRKRFDLLMGKVAAAQAAKATRGESNGHNGAATNGHTTTNGEGDDHEP